MLIHLNAQEIINMSLLDKLVRLLEECSSVTKYIAVGNL